MSLQKWKELAEKKTLVEDFYKQRDKGIKDYKFRRAASADFYSRAFEPITEKLEEQTEKLGKRLEEQADSQLALMQPAIEAARSSDPQAIEATGPLGVDGDAQIDKRIIDARGLPTPLELLFEDPREVEEIRKSLQQISAQIGQQIKTNTNILKEAKEETEKEDVKKTK